MSERRSFSDGRLSQAAVLGLATAASGYTAKRIEDAYRYEAAREEVLPILDRAVRRSEVQTRLALHEHSSWPLVANVRTREDMRERLMDGYAAWREALAIHPGAYQCVYQERSLRTDFSEGAFGETGRLDLRVRAAPSQAAFVQELTKLNASQRAPAIFIEHAQVEVTGSNEHRIIEQGLQLMIDQIYRQHEVQAQDGAVLDATDGSPAPQFFARPSRRGRNTIEFFDRPITRLGRDSVVAELRVSDMVVYVNNIQIEQVARSINGSRRTFRVRADVVRDTGARLLSHCEE